MFCCSKLGYVKLSKEQVGVNSPSRKQCGSVILRPQTHANLLHSMEAQHATILLQQRTM